MMDALWPYLVVLLAGMLPNEMFRVAAVFLARGVSEESELFGWIRTVAVALLAAVVSKIVFAPPAALASVPSWVPMLGIAAGVAGFFVIRRLFLAIVCGEAVFTAAALLTG